MKLRIHIKSSSFYFSLLTCLFLCHSVSLLWAQTQGQKRLSLRESIELAIKNNFDIRAAEYTPRIRAADILSARGSLAPSTGFDFTTKDSRTPSSTPFLEGLEEGTGDLSVASTETQEWSLNFRDRFKTGTQYGIVFNSLRQESNSKFQVFQPYYSSALSLVLTQPLLDGFGTGANAGRILIAKNTRQLSIYQFQGQVASIVSQVQITYWDLVFAIENLKVKELALQQARDLLKFNQRQLEVGSATENDVLQAQAAVASREAEIIAAQDAVKDKEDGLKRLTNLMEGENAWDIQIIPEDTPRFEVLTVDLEGSLKTAFENRPDFAQARIGIENKQIQLRMAKNQTLPTVDLEGTFALNGLGDNYSDTLSELGSGDFRTWKVGVFLKYPIGDPTAKGELQRRRMENEQALMNLKSLEQQIVIEVREAVRQLETNHKRIIATQSALELEERKLAGEQKKYELGLTTSYNLLQFQADLSLARTGHLKAIIDYNKAIVQLAETLGTTLKENNVQLAE